MQPNGLGSALDPEDPMMILGIVDLLVKHGLDTDRATKMARHRHSSRYDVTKIRREGWFELYQSLQRRPFLDGCDQLVSFIGTGRTAGVFVGVHEVLRRRPATSVELPRSFPYPEWVGEDRFFYDLRPVEGFEALVDRVTIDWGRGTRSWVQFLRNKPIIELSPPGRTLSPFVDYQAIDLSHDELRTLYASPDAHREWRASLRAVGGIYLIVATTSGQQYIGSACGAEGIWGRWQAYATNGHGGNRLLGELVESDGDYPASFRFSILHVLPSTTTQKEVLAWESVFKTKLGTRATGLNLN